MERVLEWKSIQIASPIECADMKRGSYDAYHRGGESDATLVREASQPTAPSTPGILYGHLSIVLTLAATPHPLPNYKSMVLLGAEQDGPRRKELGLLEILIQYLCGYRPKAVHGNQSFGNLMNCTARP